MHVHVLSDITWAVRAHSNENVMQMVLGRQYHHANMIWTLFAFLEDRKVMNITSISNNSRRARN